MKWNSIVVASAVAGYFHGLAAGLGYSLGFAGLWIFAAAVAAVSVFVFLVALVGRSSEQREQEWAIKNWNIRKDAVARIERLEKAMLWFEQKLGEKAPPVLKESDAFEPFKAGEPLGRQQ